MKKFSFILIAVLLIGCGGGGGGGGDTPTPPPPPSATFNLSKYNSLATGPVYLFQISGTDTAGGNYTGSQSLTVDGPTVFEGINVIQKRKLMTLNETGVGVILNVVATLYFRQSDNSLYKIVFNNGVTAVPIGYNPSPPTVKIGDFGSSGTLNYSNGVTLTTTWQVFDGGNGLAELMVISTTNGTLSERDSIFVNSAGDIISAEFKIYNFPTNGVTTILTSSGFTPGAGPTATTLTANSVGVTGATLNGNATPNGLVTTAWFEWGTDPTLTSFSRTSSQSVGSGTTSQPVNTALTGLVTGTTYYYRIAASNGSGTTKGSILSFTPGGAPNGTTLAATSVAATIATLNGNVTANGLPTTSWFEWGTDSTFSTYNSTSSQSVGSGTTSQPVNTALTGLATGTTYYYRVAASNSSGTTKGSILNFTPDILISISIIPTDRSIALGGNKQYFANGTYSAAGTKDISSFVNWISDNNSVATINSVGLANSVGVGTTNITASYSGKSATTSLTVTPVAIISISMTQFSVSIFDGQTIQLHVNGIYSDGSIVDITNLANWSVPFFDASEVTVGNTVSNKGLVTGIGVGTAQVHAEYGGFVEVTFVEVK